MNVLLGGNGEGKTNVLEAVYFLSLLRSFRTGKVGNLKQAGYSEFCLEGVVTEEDAFPVSLGVSYGQERRLVINGSPVDRSSAFVNQFLCLTLIPQDLELIQGPPSLRRRCMDIAISQWSRSYLLHLQSFQLALKTRNIMLKEPDRYSESAFKAYDEQLVREGAVVEWMRMDFVRQLNEILFVKSDRLLTRGRKLSVIYQSRCGTKGREPSTVEELADWYREELEAGRAGDIAQAATRFGPHRSELLCLLNGCLLSDFGSEGECRMASLALRFACLEILCSHGQSAKVTVLVDDVTGELDEEHKQLFFKEIAISHQVIFACTQIPRELRDTGQVLHVSGGMVTR